MYEPPGFTHQGIRNHVKNIVTLVQLAVSQDKSQLEVALKPAIDFQKNYGVTWPLASSAPF